VIESRSGQIRRPCGQVVTDVDDRDDVLAAGIRDADEPAQEPGGADASGQHRDHLAWRVEVGAAGRRA
jgi:hypothetical protein